MTRFKKLLYKLSFVASVFGGGVIVKDWVNGEIFEEDVDVTGKVAVVTGASSGVGYHVAKSLAKHGAKVYLACRDRDRCSAALEDIVIETNNKNVYCRYCDLSSQDSIKRFARRFNSDEAKLDILVNNAGVIWAPRELTDDGLESHIGVNHMGHFLLTNLLLEKLKVGAPSRVVNVTSDKHVVGNINVEDLNSENNYREDHAYSQSKLAMMLFTQELAKRLEGSGVTVNAVNPGRVHSFFFKRGFHLSTWWPTYKSQKAAAESVVNVALSTKLKGVTGKYFDEFEMKEPSPKVLDDKLNLWMWLVSEKWTKLTDAQKEVGLAVTEKNNTNTKTPAIPATSTNNLVKNVTSVTSSNEGTITQPS